MADIKRVDQRSKDILIGDLFQVDVQGKTQYYICHSDNGISTVYGTCLRSGLSKAYHPSACRRLDGEITLSNEW